MSAPLLQLDGIGVEYPSTDRRPPVTVVEHVTLAVDRCQLVCVAGRSGSGKTSVLNVAAALQRPSAGSVWWEDVNPATVGEAKLPKLRRERIGYVFQGGGLIDSLTANENVALAGIPGGLARDASSRVVSLLARLDVAHVGDHFPAELSGGEANRVALARALFLDPPLLIVDEPTANLDRRAADGVISLLAELRTSGHGVLVASHDPHLLQAADVVHELESS